MKLSDSQIVQIRNLHKQGVRQTDIADRFGVSQALISLIVRGKRRNGTGVRLLQERLA
jgi:transcriptional regulator with XRE-family HTH domain